MGRKNAKTTLAACLLLAHLCGPPARNKPNSQLFSAAQSRDQAAIIFALAAKMVRLNRELAQAVTIRETAKELLCPELGTRYRALTADATTAYGLSPVLIVHDELGQVRGPRTPLYEALETATGAQEEPLSIVITTQAPTDADLLSVLIDDALAGHDPRAVVSLHTAPWTWTPSPRRRSAGRTRRLGPSLTPGGAGDGGRRAAHAGPRGGVQKSDPKPTGRGLNPFVSPAVWSECGGPVGSASADVPVYGGLDLSEIADLTALVLIAWRDGKWRVEPTFWLPPDGLSDKAR